MDDKVKEVREALNEVMVDHTDKDEQNEAFAAHSEETKLTERFDNKLFNEKHTNYITKRFQQLISNKHRGHFVPLKPEAFMALIDEFIERKSSISVKQLMIIRKALEAIRTAG